MPHQVRHDIYFVIPAEAKRIAGIQPLILLFSLLGFKTPSGRSRAGCMIKDTVVMLSERPNVRVHNDPLSMCPARESAAGGRETPGVPFLGGTASLGTQRRGAKKSLKIFCLYFSLFGPKAKYQKKSRPQLGLRLSSRNT